MTRPTPSTTPPTTPPQLGTGGRCTLVGAGPGDPELLTLKALKAIQAATVLLVDDLVSDAIVAHASPSAHQGALSARAQMGAGRVGSGKGRAAHAGCLSRNLSCKLQDMFHLPR